MKKIFLLPIFIIILSLLVSATSWLPVNPTAYWKFENSLSDSSGNDLTLYNQSAVNSFTTSSKIGTYARNYSSSGLYDYNLSSSLVFGTGNFTFGFWFNGSAGSARASNVYMLTSSGTNGGTEWVVFANNSGNFVIREMDGATITIVNSTSNMFNNMWQRIIFVRENTSTNGFKVYWNGTLIKSNTWARNFIENNFTVGGIRSNDVKSPNFTMDDLFVFKGYAWNQSQVTYDWNSGLGREIIDTGIYPIITPSAPSTAFISDNIIFNLTVQTNTSTNVFANLIFNNTDYGYTTRTIVNENTTILSKTLTIPSNIGSATGTNSTWWWNVTTINNRSSYNNITVYTVQVDNCTTNTNRIMNITIYDEDARTLLNGTIETLIDIYSSSGSLLTSYNSSFIGISKTQICINPNLNATNPYYNYQIKYYNDSYRTEYKYGQHIIITPSNYTQIINLYDILTSRAYPFTISIKGSNFLPIDGAVLDVQRQYVGQNLFISVESPLTDSDGKAVANLVERDIIYRFMVLRDNQLLGTFDNYRVSCNNEATNDCSFNLNVATASSSLIDYSTYLNLSYSFSLDSSTRILSMPFYTTDGNTKNVSFYTVLDNGYGNTTICSDTEIASTGTLLCTIPQAYGNVSIITTLYSDGEYVSTDYRTIGTSIDYFSGVKVVFLILMYSMLVFLFIDYPLLMILGAILGIICGGIFFLLNNGSLFSGGSIILWFIVAGIIVMWRLSKNL